MSDELCSCPLPNSARRCRQGRFAGRVTCAVLERAGRLQPGLNCFSTLCGDEAWPEARNAEREVWPGGRWVFFMAFLSR